MRTKTVKNILDKKFDTFDLNPPFRDVMGLPEKAGIWLIYGKEKHGKTWFALMLAKELSKQGRTLYISAEEGMGKTFADSVLRAGLNHKDKVQFIEYIELPELYERLKKRIAPKVVFIDNATFYNDELKNKNLRQLLQDFPYTLFILLAHEERNEPYTALAKLARKLAKIIVRVEGLACYVSGRCPGGALTIDSARASLYHGQNINQHE